MKEVQQMHVGVGISFHRPGLVFRRVPVVLGFCEKPTVADKPARASANRNL